MKRINIFFTETKISQLSIHDDIEKYIIELKTNHFKNKLYMLYDNYEKDNKKE